MNYRHIYHAGNFADVFKHCILIMLLESLRLKDKPFRFIDTHAGIGRYDLTSIEAQKTLEQNNGVVKVFNSSELPKPAVIAKYLEIIQQLNGGGSTLRCYPGSPYFARALLRPQDKMQLCELHPQDYLTLKNNFNNDKQVSVHSMDGYQSLKAFLPPIERRGLVMIDPAFETDDEFERIQAALIEGMKRWSTGIYVIWYPIKNYMQSSDFLKTLKLHFREKLLVAEIKLDEKISKTELNACGIAIINPPWQLELALKDLLEWLKQSLVHNKSEFYQIN